MLHKLSVIFIVIMVLAISSCQEMVKGSGEYETIQRDVKAFEELILVGNFRVLIKISDSNLLELTADKNYLPYITTEFNGDTLSIRVDDKVRIEANEAPRITLQAKELETLRIIGSSQVIIEGLPGKDFDLVVDGSGEVALAGAAEDLSIKLIGSGRIHADKLIAEEVDISIVGSASAELHVVNELIASISGSGHINYYGTPRNIQQTVSGSGRVRGLDNYE